MRSRRQVPATHDALLRRPIAEPVVQDIIAYWDFARAISTTRAEDISPNRHHGRLVNLRVPQGEF